MKQSFHRRSSDIERSSVDDLTEAARRLGFDETEIGRLRDLYLLTPEEEGRDE